MKSSKLIYGAALALSIIAAVIWYATKSDDDALTDLEPAAQDFGLRVDDSKAQTSESIAESTESKQPEAADAGATTMEDESEALGESTEGDPEFQSTLDNGPPVEIDPEINSEIAKFEIPTEGDEVQRMDKTFDLIQRSVLYLKENRVNLPQATADKLVRLSIEAYGIDKSDYSPSLIANLLPEYEKEVRAAMQANDGNPSTGLFSKAFENINKME